MPGTNNAVMSIMGSLGSLTYVLVLGLAATAACRNASGDEMQPSGLHKKAPVRRVEAGGPIETTYDKMLADRAEKADQKGLKINADGEIVKDGYVPAEFKSGSSKWKDVGVYVDGKPMGFLTFGELPISLKPTWVEERASVDMRPGTNDPDFKMVRQRFYRFDEYLKAIGIDLRTVKELHVYGPKFTETNISTSKELLSPRAKDFTFRFGSNTSGKPIPHIPDNFGNDRAADKIASVMVYIKKKPPTLIPNQGFELDGVPQEGVPYFGEPIRGGVRVYFDDKLAAIIKRQELDAKRAVKGTDGELEWKLADVLAAQGLDLKKAAELWVVRDDLRAEHFTRDEFMTMAFSANSQQKGGVLLGPKKLRANVIALHSKPVKEADLPRPTPDDD